MFYDFLMESAGSYDISVSESTREMVDNIEVVDFSESTMSPFDLVSKSLYEYAQYNNDIFNKISKAEVAYLRENGVEPVWEAVDFKALGSKFINGIKDIIAKITGAFKKLIETINRKIADVYRTYGAKMDAKVNDSKYDVNKARFTMRTYDPIPGHQMLLNQNPESIIRNTDYIKDLYDFFSHDARNYDGIAAKIKGANADEISKSLRAAAFKGFSGDQVASNEAARKALRDKMVGEKKKMTYTDARKELDYFTKDRKGVNLKDTLNKNYKKIKEDLSKLIDLGKKYSTVDGKKCPSNISGLYVGQLQNYATCVTIIYNETNKVHTAKWFQSMRLFIKLTASTMTGAKKEKEGKVKNESFSFEGYEGSYDNDYDDNSEIVYDI